MPGPNVPYTNLDFAQVIQQSFDEANDRLRVDAVVTASIGEVKITDGTNDATLTNVSGKYGLDVNVLNDIFVDISHTDDSIRLGDGTGFLTSTVSSGKRALDVYVIDSTTDDVINVFNEITSVSSSTLTTIVTYTAPLIVQTYLQRVSFAGTNIAKYGIYVNSVLIDQFYTYFGGNLSGNFEFQGGNIEGYQLTIGDIVEIKVEHFRPMLGNFNARIQVVQK